MDVYVEMWKKRPDRCILKSFNYVYPEGCEVGVDMCRSCCMAVKCCWNGVVRSARLY